MSQENQASRRVGDRLRQAREQQGISVADAAERLHILPSYVNAMETGRYGVLPGTVFLRGYVRSYARMLRLNEDEVVAQLDRELGASDDELAKRQVAVQETYQSNRRNMMVMLAAAVVLIIGGIWFLQQEPPDTDSVADRPAETRSFDNSPSVLDDLSEPTSDAPVVRTIDPNESPGAVEQPSNAVDEATSKQAETSPRGLSATSDTAAGNLESASSTVPSASTSAEPESSFSEPATPATVDTTAAPEVAGQDRLEVQFTGECWFELTDSAGGRQRGLYKDGDSFVHTGPAPFKIVVGAVSETQMVFNGTPIDFADYRVRGNRLGLTLGQ